MKNLSVYIHIPFCIKKCKYCDFLSYPASEEEQEAYVTMLLMEIEKQSLFYNDYQVISVFIGGGTPSVLDGKAIEAIMRKLKEKFNFVGNPEITIEVNPGTVTEDKLALYLQAGINRLSIGLQSADDNELRILGRIHDYNTFLCTYELARKLGFRNINVDLISAIPGQTYLSHRETLNKVLSLKPEHISAYSLILEEGTWFYEHSAELTFHTEEEEIRLYKLTEKMLSECDYNRYEISNYAQKGFECIHNKTYWLRGNYVGFGLGAASLVDEVRWNNKRTVKEYEKALCKKSEHNEQPISPDSLSQARTQIGENVQYLTIEEQMEEFMFLGLRLMEGIEKKAFKIKFGLDIEDVYGKTLGRLQNETLIISDEQIRLTPLGIDVSNYVMSKFLLS
ncbi:MAG: radical SAM family heme chaperone HemW [Lachnospiraceae bacterium]|nr:radical SAM family heme chaperone HemW [Lachnospiraceae bacterium]